MALIAKWQTATKLNYISINLIYGATPISANRQRGRPKGKRSLQRSHLLAAARDLLASGTPRDLNLRQVAQAAGVTPALANYYFGSRDGLMEALFGELLASHVDEVLTTARGRSHQPQQAITALLQRICMLLSSDPLLRHCLWLAIPAATRLRSQLRSCLRELLVRGQNTGALRNDLSPDYLADSLLGMVLFHFIEQRDTGPQDPEAVAQLMLQHVALLRDGILHSRRQ